MKAHISTNQNIENDELYFYNSCYNALEKLEKVYLPNFSLENIKKDIVNTVRVDERKIYYEMLSLKNLIFSVLLGLKKEELESANSLVKQHQLFQYKDYDGEVDVYIDGDNSLKWKDYAKSVCKYYNFNPKQEGSFPLMLEITKDNNKNRPYDYVSKIRNAYLHGQYKPDKLIPVITHIWNTDDNGNIIFEGKILSDTFAAFVMDFFGFSSSVGSEYVYYHFPTSNENSENKTIEDFLNETKCVQLKFIEIPQNYKFSGQKGGIFEQLNACFGKDTMEFNDVYDKLIELEKQGVKYDTEITDFPLDKIEEFIKHISKKESKNAELFVNSILADIKLQFSPISEITNCFTNINNYIDFKIQYMMEQQITPDFLFQELKGDEVASTSFMYAIAFLKLHLINYAIESKNIKEFDYEVLDLNDVTINNLLRFNDRKNEIILDGYSDKAAHNKLVLEIMRNALAHGGDRIEVSLETNCKVKFTDKYQNLPEVSVEISLDKINEIFKAFNPKMFNEKGKTKTLFRK